MTLHRVLCRVLEYWDTRDINSKLTNTLEHSNVSLLESAKNNFRSTSVNDECFRMYLQLQTWWPAFSVLWYLRMSPSKRSGVSIIILETLSIVGWFKKNTFAIINTYEISTVIYINFTIWRMMWLIVTYIILYNHHLTMLYFNITSLSRKLQIGRWQIAGFNSLCKRPDESLL